MKIGDKPRFEVTSNELIEFGNQLIEWLTLTDEDGNPSDNFLYSEFCQKHNLFESDIDYFINYSYAFYELMKKAEEIQRVKIKGFAASNKIQPAIAKKLLSERSKIIRKDEAKVKKPKTLTRKQIAFCEEYIIDRNGKQAAIRAGYAEKNAEITASKYLRISKVEDYIAELEQKALDRNEITKDRILREVAALAFSDPRDYIDSDNIVISIKDLPREKAIVVKKIKTIKTEIISDGEHIGNKTTTEIELEDKLKSIDMINKMLGHYPSVKIEGDINIKPITKDLAKKIINELGD